MAQTSFVTVEDIKEAITKFSKKDQIKLDEEVHKYLEVFTLMGDTETAFFAWLEPEEDI